MIENNLGYSSNLTIVIAAIISDEHRIEHRYIITVVSKLNSIVLSGLLKKLAKWNGQKYFYFFYSTDISFKAFTLII